MRRRRHAQRRRAVVAARAIGVGRLVGVDAAGPAGEARRRARVTGDAVAAGGRHVIRIGGGAVRALRALARDRIRCGRHRSGSRSPTAVVHRVGGEARRRVGVAVAALDVAPDGMCGGVVIPNAVVPLWQVEQLVSVAWWT